jgi:hypothetical protein
VAVLCNVSSGNASQAAQRVADLYLGGALAPPAAGGQGGRQGGEGAGRGGGRGRGGAAAFTPDPTDLPGYVGRYVSDEAEAVYEIAIENGALVLKRRPDSVTELRGIARDEFRGPSGTIRFIRDAAGVVTELSVRGSRVFDMRFARR